jgi:hypothetical protein
VGTGQVQVVRICGRSAPEHREGADAGTTDGDCGRSDSDCDDYE